MRKLEPSFHERIWGVTDLAPWFLNAPTQASSQLIGEVWFETPEVPLLVKFLFTRERLSVQVHPDDDYALRHHNSPGKTEMWHVLEAEPGAKIAAGFREPVTREHLRAAALNGEVEQLLQWHTAARGDTFLIPAGTVHAIGSGLTICEIQQRSDITYRLYDYGRGRELHLDHALAVSQLWPHQPRCEPPVSCGHFVTESATGPVVLPATRGPALLIVIGGSGQVDGRDTRPGDVWLTDSQVTEINGTISLLRAQVPLP